MTAIECLECGGFGGGDDGECKVCEGVGEIVTSTDLSKPLSNVSVAESPLPPLDVKRPEPMFVCGICEGTLFRPTPTGLVCANCQPAPSDEKAGQEVEFALIATYQDFAAAPSVPSDTPNTNSAPVSSTLVDGDTPEEIGEGEIEDALITLEHGADSVADVVFAKETIRAAFQEKQERIQWAEDKVAVWKDALEELRDKAGAELRARDERVAELEEEITVERFCTDRETNSHQETMRLCGEQSVEIQRLASELALSRANADQWMEQYGALIGERDAQLKTQPTSDALSEGGN